MTELQKLELLVKFQDEFNLMIKSLPSQFENPNVNDYKKGLFDAYKTLLKVVK